MKRLSPILLIAAALIGSGCQQTLTAPDVVPVGCGEPVGGWFELPAETSLEAQPGYDALLAGADLDSLPPTLPVTTAPMERALIAYMLETDVDALPLELERDVLLARLPMGPAIALAYIGHPEGPDLSLLRRGLHRFYACSRQAPATLSDFDRAVGLPVGQAVTVHSSAKNTERRLRGDGHTVWMAETVLADGSVRETELIIAGRRGDGALDFLVYDSEGRLSDRSRFENDLSQDISGAAPYVCVVCHSAPPDFQAGVIHP